ncbi:MAG: phosphoribosylformylglycinamidine synthase subunit PurS [Actinomycetota bacterium]|nr:phosphoribosylformylglycinamidine synthase subunit PurS [Actinomycetota bacterium]
MPKAGISDPQGQTIERALPALGYTGVKGVRVGKRIMLEIEAATEDEASARATEMCERLLANTVIEAYEVAIGEARTEGAQA